MTGLQLSQLQTGYIHRGHKHIVSDGLEASLPLGHLAMLLGPNGSGKSTLMHTIAGLQTALSGEIRIIGQDAAHTSLAQRAKLLSLVLTERIYSEVMTVEELVAIGRYPHIGYMARLGHEDKRIITEAIKRCRLEDMGTRPLAQLSDGERQRVMVARALAQDTPLILLDEPTAHLDLPSRIELIAMLRQLAHDMQRCILLSTHELDLALSWADSLWLMNKEGQLYTGNSSELIESGALEATFGNAWLTFDKTRRSFVLKDDYTVPK